MGAVAFCKDDFTPHGAAMIRAINIHYDTAPMGNVTSRNAEYGPVSKPLENISTEVLTLTLHISMVLLVALWLSTTTTPAHTPKPQLHHLF